MRIILNKVLIRITSFFFIVIFYMGFIIIMGIAGYLYWRFEIELGGLSREKGGLANFVTIVLGLMVAIFMVMWILKFFGSFSQPEKSLGIPAVQMDLPTLQQTVFKVADDLGVKKPNNIEILGLPNAYASEALSGRGTIRNVYIGWPLILMLTESELKAIIAHELAHFDNDAFFLHRAFWQIETGLIWMRKNIVDEGGTFFIPSLVVRIYVMLFWLGYNLIATPFRFSFEYYCDKKAAQQYGKNMMSIALQKVVALQITYEKYLQQLNSKDLQFSYQQYFAYHQNVVSQASFDSLLQDVSLLSDEAHPPLSNRLKNISHLPSNNITTSEPVSLSYSEITSFEEKLMALIKR